jgi:uncharacterized protein YgbK (DUF1537 family)
MNPTAAVTRAQLLAGQPPPWPDDPFADIRATVAASATRLVVLDDDPTGTQTVHGMPVLTTWPVGALEAELRNPGPGFFILTNSRSLPATAAASLGREIGANLRCAVDTTGVHIQVISRSDSTLRGHFPGEVDAFLQAMGTPDLPRIIAPCFFEGGRLTAGDIHYVAENDRLIPATQTPYAQDAAFGYRHSNLRDWVAEKTGGRVSANQVASVTLADLRTGGPRRVAERLVALPPQGCCVVNALEYRDLEVFVAGLLAAEKQGRHFFLRSAASLVRVRAGISPTALLGRAAMAEHTDTGGLFVVGSYVPKTSAQLEALLTGSAVASIEIRVRDLLEDRLQAEAVAAASKAATQALSRGRDTVLFTSRHLEKGTDADSSLAIGRRISKSLIAIVSGIDCQPRYLVAKGGITSSDLATLGLGVRRAMIMGQMLPGVPVWRLGGETRWPGMAYIVFPGNVGEDDALAVIQQRLANSN